MRSEGRRRLRRGLGWAALLLVAYAGAIVWLSGSMIAPPRPRVSGSARPVLGLSVREAQAGGLHVRSVVSPAREAGIRPGDRIVALDGAPVGSSSEFLEAIRGSSAGQVFRVEARRPDPSGGEGGVLVEVTAEVRPISPADLGLAFEDVSFRSRWGLTLRGWYVPPPGGPGRAPGVAYGHGNATDRRQGLEHAWEVHRRGFAQLLFDFAGRGESDGEVITLGEREADDLAAALAFLRERPDVDANRLALVGRSMGAAAAVRCASGRSEVRALVIDSAYGDLAEVVDDLARARHIPPVLLRPALLAAAGFRADYDPAALRPVDSMRGVKCPVLILHGTEDRIVSFANASALAKAAGRRATLVPLAGLGHNDPRPPELATRVARFLSTAVNRAR